MALSHWQEAANKRYPRSAARRRIFGDGQFVLIVACKFPGKVLLYPTKEARQRKLIELDRGCCYECRDEHIIAELTVTPATEQEKHDGE
jgi:hypothetical protein